MGVRQAGLYTRHWVKFWLYALLHFLLYPLLYGGGNVMDSDIMEYITIDGDDIGRKITSCYIGNDVERLQVVSQSLKTSTTNISDLLTSRGFNIVFCAADGVVASIEGMSIDFLGLFESINHLAPEGMSFSAGVGNNLREAYVALLAAKSSGKNCLCQYFEIISSDDGTQTWGE